jgi:GntR family transcriptional regulator / MocR family aminotransferase
MPGSGTSLFPIIRVDRAAQIPLYKQLYDGYRSAIIRGELRPGQPVPSSRELADELQVSRFPVLQAYSQLSAEGYFEGRVGAGTYISSSLPEPQLSTGSGKGSSLKRPRGPRPVSKRAVLYPKFDDSVLKQGWGAFGVHQPALDQFPFHLWSALISLHSKNPHASAIHQINPLGSERLQAAICAHLRTSRAVQCEAHQIMVVSGSQQALDITARVLLDPGNTVWVEEPGYYLGRVVLQAAGCHLAPIPVDREGMDVLAGIKRFRRARAAIVTPSHQYPLGSTMSASRRLMLLDWAHSSGAWIVEDDYDSEYRFDANPIASLQGLDPNARVVYIGTFSKVLFPSIRVGYIVIPSDLIERFVAVRYAMDIFPPYLIQEVLADFMSEGHFAKHLRRTRQHYKERRTLLIESIREEMGGLAELHGDEAGMHLTVTVSDSFLDREVAAAASRERLWLRPLSPAYIGKTPRQGFILGYGSTAADQIAPAVRRLRSLMLGE